MPVAGAADPALGIEGEEPPQVLRRDEVPGRAEDVRPDELAGIERRVDGRLRGVPGPLRQRPRRAGVVLRLDGDEVPDDLGG